MKKIIFLSGGINPNSAPFNRFYAIYKMMKLAEYQTLIVCVRPFYKKIINSGVAFSNNRLIYEDIICQNVYRFKGRKSFIKKLFLRFRTYRNAVAIIRKESKDVQSILYLNTVDFTDYIVFYFVSMIYGLKYIKERSEYPELIRSPKKLFTKVFKHLILPWNYKFFDGMVIMTQPLIDFYKKYTRDNCSIVKIPMTVDPSRFEINDLKSTAKYFGYVGGLNCDKDGLDILIKGFSIISSDFPDYELKIAGVPTTIDEKEILVQLVKELGVENRVHFIGGLNRSEIPKFLLSASILIMARPDSKQAEGGFPTKLGEYLMTGKPVIVTDVGEISSYLDDGKNAFIIKPGCESHLAERIEYILKEPEKARLVGEEGRKAAREYFDYSNYTRHMRDFIESLY